MEFIEALQSPKCKIKQPTQRGFDLKAWENHHSHYTFHQRQSLAAYSFGIILFRTLEALREQLAELDKRKPNSLSVDVLKRHFVSLSNRHRKAFSQHTQLQLRELEKVNESGEIIVNNISNLRGASIGPGDTDNGSLNLTDSAHQIVDNFRLILGALLTNSQQPKQERGVLEHIGEMQWLYAQEMISAIYDLLESYWHLIVFEENIPEYDKAKELVVFNPICNELNIAKAVSLMRMENHRSSLSAVTASIIKRYGISDDKVFPIEVKKNRGTAYREAKVNGQSFELISTFASARNDAIEIKDSISKKVFEKKSDKFPFSLSDIVDVFISLRAFVYWKYEKLSSNTEFYKKGDLSRFNVEININELSKVVSRCVSKSLENTKNIIEFLHFAPRSEFDLWSNPLIRKNSTKSFVLIAPFMEAVLSRNAEFWLRQLDIKLSEKGNGFEDYIRARIQDSIEKSPLSDITFQIPEKIIKFSGKSEEIDSVVFLGNRVLVSEIKNIVAVDSPVSFATASSRVKEGVVQAKRKAQFLFENKHELVSRYDVNIDPADLVFVPLVFVSNFIFAGCTIDDVVVTDQLIFEAFFLKQGLIPILSYESGTSFANKLEVEIYRSPSDAPNSVEKYLSNPPQLQLIKNSLFCAFYESSIDLIPGSKIALRRLEISQDHSINLIANTDFGFPLIEN